MSFGWMGCGGDEGGPGDVVSGDGSFLRIAYIHQKMRTKRGIDFSFFGTFFGGVYGGWTYTVLINSLLEGWVLGALIGSDQGVFFFWGG